MGLHSKTDAFLVIRIYWFETDLHWKSFFHYSPFSPFECITVWYEIRFTNIIKARERRRGVYELSKRKPKLLLLFNYTQRVVFFIFAGIFGIKKYHKTPSQKEEVPIEWQKIKHYQSTEHVKNNGKIHACYIFHVSCMPVAFSSYFISSLQLYAESFTFYST